MADFLTNGTDRLVFLFFGKPTTAVRIVSIIINRGRGGGELCPGLFGLMIVNIHTGSMVRSSVLQFSEITHLLMIV